MKHNKFTKYRKRKAVSPVIATLLLIAIAVAAAIIVYSFVTGLVGGLSTGGGSNQVALAAAFSSTGNVVVLTLKNTGSVATSSTTTLPTLVAGFKLNGVTCTATTVGCPTAAVTWNPAGGVLTPGETGTVTYVAFGPLVSGTAYTISFTVTYPNTGTVIASATATST